MIVVGEQAGKHISNYSEEFKSGFLSILSRQYGTKRVRANNVYQEYIQDKTHIHMNSTRWLSLTEFVKFLGRQGIVKADEIDGKWFIAWVDNSPQALARTEAAQKKERHHMDDEERERKLINEQIARARAQHVDAEVKKDTLLQRSMEPIKLSLGPQIPKADGAGSKTQNALSKPKNVFKVGSGNSNPFKSTSSKRALESSEESSKRRKDDTFQ